MRWVTYPMTSVAGGGLVLGACDKAAVKKTIKKPLPKSTSVFVIAPIVLGFSLYSQWLTRKTPKNNAEASRMNINTQKIRMEIMAFLDPLICESAIRMPNKKSVAM